MARFSSIFNLLVIFVSYHSFVDGVETTLEERRAAVSKLYEDLDGFVSNNYKSKDTFDKCCNDKIEKQNFRQFELYACVENTFSKYKKGLGEIEQTFRGQENEANRKKLIDIFKAYLNAFNSEDGTKTTCIAFVPKSDDIKEWIRTVETGYPIFNPQTSLLSDS